MLLRGFVQLNCAGTAVVGAAVYIRTSDGDLTFVAPESEDNIVRVAGYCVGKSASKQHIYFNPGATWVKVA